ncbi:hypothetical protein SCB29_13655 [Paraburkholderia sp. SIMBA_055]|jgi:hypothetical protein|uniref:Uncharacterized protein n=2 Tax=Paraburkholderia graminis TaxID=60548 RepID=B1GAM0_PARG4|nr:MULTISPECIES: hypothetical protein [Paraburkholderia]ALE54396.1 hypothetical protein AC233_06475 [Burkholderia sp. HB1]AXF07696.1 hypothetical protein CUJ91_06975 [Paraburkholderia graminis]EDT06822.1 conserved hypothetical protein [Paraburkholderia graminis C4D1M]MDQ0622675.1 hypothetical protein [Paraburkholderia graminis]MDR6207147.1 hypothetical protein [Paraburkholderia graminis]
MKPMSLLLCGIVLSSMAASALAQQRPQGWNWRPDRTASVEAWQRSAERGRNFTPPAPRGDLRGDIASNVRTRPEAPHGDAPRRR